MNKVNIVLIAFIILFSTSCSQNDNNNNEYISNGIGTGGTIGNGEGGGDL